jgi:peptidoglycan/LPS O-acetylase OafA/YrhL
MADNNHISSLDGLRGIAAFIVVVSHVASLIPAIGPLPGAQLGEQGVAIFFALSGFLMAYLYGGKALTRQAALDYLVHRFARIYPVYLFAVAVAALLSSWPGLNYIDTLVGTREVARHILLLGSKGVFWSIPPEIQFYLFFLLLWRCFAQPHKSQTLVAIIATLFVIDAMLDFPGPGIVLISKLPYFLFGALAGRMRALEGRRNGHAVLAVGIAALSLLVLFIPSRVFGFFPYGHFWGLKSALASAVIVYLVAGENAASAKVLAAPPLLFIGKISFSLYLLHVPVVFFVNRLLSAVLPPVIVVALSLLASIAVAWLSYRLIEGPSRRFIVSLWRSRRAVLASPATTA